MKSPGNIATAAQVAYAVEQVYAGVDWLSCSLMAGADNTWLWADECRRIIEEIAEEGYKLEARSLNGYHGLAAGGSFFGVRDDGLYLQISSYRADHYLSRIYRTDLHFSRLDVQATVRFASNLPGIGEEAERMAVDANEALPSQRQRRIWHMAGNDGGYTLYIGSPASEQRGRLYNKAVQSEDPIYTRCWRYEVIFKNNFAQHWADKVAYAEENTPNLCQHIVWRWYTGRGVECPWRSFEGNITMPLFNEIPSDAEKKLNWLQSQVKPAFRWLLKNGFEREAFEAIGLRWEYRTLYTDEYTPKEGDNNA